MPKMKTNKSVAKRLRVTGTGMLKHSRANKTHNTGQKTPRRKRRLRQSTLVDSTIENNMKKLMPYL